MRYFLALAATGLTAVLQYPLRSAATIGCVLAILLPYVAGLAVSKGVQSQAEEAARLGADLYVTEERLGREQPVSMDLARAIQDIDGVTQVIPRIVARLLLGKNREEAVLVGMPLEHFRGSFTCIEGRLPGPSPLNELVLGRELARRLKLQVGSVIPPFYHNARGDRLSRVVGVFKSDVSIWESRLILTSLETARVICNQEDLATDLLVYCRPKYQERVREAILRLRPAPSRPTDPRNTLAVTTRDDLIALLPRGLLHREGIFNLLFLVAFVVGILTVLVTSGIGTSERRREIGILKATGWQTDEILVRSLVESLLLSLAGAALAIVLAFVWLRLGNGYWIASIFLAGVDVQPDFPVPFQLTPVPALLGFLISAVIVLSGTLYSTWRAAIAPPREAMR
jgi:ABC-type lipoprotein release transport system permease subunit